MEKNYPIVKQECVGHVQKRLGTALRNYKKNLKGLKMSDGGRVEGRGRLSDNVIDKMQKYYGRAIRENSGDLDKMKIVSGQFTTIRLKMSHLPFMSNTSCALKVKTRGANFGRTKHHTKKITAFPVLLMKNSSQFLLGLLMMMTC